MNFYDNKLAVDHLLSKPNGLFSLIDDASIGRRSEDYIIDQINSVKSQYLKRNNSTHQFAFSHYTGTGNFLNYFLVSRNINLLI